MPAGKEKNAQTRVVYASSLMSAETYSALFSRAETKPSPAAQKYHSLMTRGLVQNGCEVIALTALPVSRKTSQRRFVRLPDDRQDGVHFRYLTIIRYPVIKHLVVYLGAFTQAFRLLKKDGFAVCDGLNIAVSSGVRAAAHIRRRPCVAIVTDVPEILFGGKAGISAANTRELAKFDGYVLLTEPMNALVNPNNRPYLVAEGQVDVTMAARENLLSDKHPEKVCFYAGMLHEEYGVLKLAKAFQRVKDQEARLVYYGDGNASKVLRELAAQDERIELRGSADNATVVNEELRATLLINPRPTGELFTQYSFPSKNLEYMVSGTPMITTKLAGMPRAYDEFVYLFLDESEEGIAKTLEETLALPRETLHQKGLAAKAYVLREKSNTSQAARVLTLLRQLDRGGIERNHDD